MEEMIQKWLSGEKKDISESETIISKFEQRVEENEDRIAVIYGEYEYCYGELNERANQIAYWLIGEGVEKESLVAIMFERSYDMMACILGIWKAGAAYIPIDMNYPKERIVDILEDAKPCLVIHNLSENNDFSCKNISLEMLKERIDDFSKQNPNILIEQTQLAYVIYTSGSTGKPKGAMIEHIGMLNHMYSKVEVLSLDENSIIAQNASHCFDISVWQFFCSLLVGACTVIFSNELVLDEDRFLSQVEEDGVTVLELVPSYLSIVLENENDNRLVNLEYIVVTGERISINLVEKWFQQYNNIPMINAYGPTEASDDITHYIMKELPHDRVVYVGMPIRNMDIFIVDNKMNLCNEGECGEICVAGIGVGRGYLYDEAKTSRAYSICPFLKNNCRMYRTGDYGKWHKNGVVEFIGRQDEQVKIHGHRIELGEVKNLLLRHEKVKDAVVIVSDTSNDCYLCAFIVSTEKIGVEELSSVVGRFGPSYLIPSKYIFLDKFPLTDNGKVDTNQLKKLEMKLEEK